MAKKPLPVAQAINVPGRHNFGGSLYLIVRGGSAHWEYQWRTGPRSLQTKSLGHAKGSDAVSLTDARLARDAMRLERRRMRSTAAPVATSPAPLVPAPVAAPIPTTTASTFPTFRAAADNYLADHKDEWGEKQRKNHKRRLELHAAALDRLPVDAITIGDVANVLRPIWTGSAHGRGAKLRGMIDTILQAQSLTQPTVASWSRLKATLPKIKKNTTHMAALPIDQVADVMRELAADDSMPARAIRFCVLTGSRQMEALGARWEEIKDDPKNPGLKIWVVPAERMKTRVTHFVALSSAALACIGSRQPGSEFLFSRPNGQPISHSSTGPALAELGRTDGDGKPITLHGFRSSFAIWAEQEFEAPARVIDKCLAHKETDQTLDSYCRSDLAKPRRELLQAWGEFATSI